jgi:hypothetical protein
VRRTPNDGIQPQLVVEALGKKHLIYFKGGKQRGNVFYVTRESKGASDVWSESKRVNSEPGSARRNGAISHARLAVDESGRAHVTWFTMRPPNYYYARMNDDGTGFEPQRSLVKRNIHGVEAGAALVTTGSDKVSLIWHAGPFAQVETRGIFMRQSTDGGRTFGVERRIDSAKAGSCPCCGLSAFADAGGRLLVSYRSAEEKIHRDMTLLNSTADKVFRMRRCKSGTFHGVRWQQPSSLPDRTDRSPSPGKPRGRSTSLPRRRRTNQFLRQLRAMGRFDERTRRSRSTGGARPCWPGAKARAFELEASCIG